MAPVLCWATVTPAGTIIANVATLSYNIAAAPVSAVASNIASFQVDELIQPVLSWQDGTPVAVNSPGSNDVLTFLLTNAGNGKEAFSLTRLNGPLPLPKGNYIPLDGGQGAIYLENGLLPGFQATGPNADTLYIPGTNDPNLAPGAAVSVYVLSNTPANVNPVNPANPAGFARGDVLLSAASLTRGAAGALPGTSLPGLGQGGVFAVVGSSRAQAGSTGSYIASGVGFVLNKTVLKVVDPQGTAVVMPGAVLTYQLVATLNGVGSISNLLINDPLPANLTYVPGSITVNGISKTDADDADNAQFIAATQTISISPGNVAAPANVVITLRATIN
jgi:uncharacterized repeat protein (TIGR01451 family)